MIRPNPGNLKFAKGKTPTPLGPLLVSWTNDTNFKLSLTLPNGVNARIELPATEKSHGVFNGDKPVRAHREGSRWLLDEDVSGNVTLEVR